MRREEENRQRIQQYTSFTELLSLWTQIRDRETNERIRGWSSGKAFEYLVLQAFALDGARVTWPYSVPIDGKISEQIDGAIYTGNLAALIEAKDYTDDIPILPIAKMRNALLRRPPATFGIIFSKRGFTDEAKILARLTMQPTVLLWEGRELEFALERGKPVRALEIKVPKAMELGVPDYSILQERNL